MAVKVHCNICEKFIKDVDKYDFQKLTGEEICTKCGEKVNKTYGKLDNMVAELEKDIADKTKRVKVVTNAFNDSVKRFSDELKSFHTTRRAELDSRIKDILT